MTFMATKKGYKTIMFFPPLFCYSWLRDPRSGIQNGKKIWIQDKHTGFATLFLYKKKRQELILIWHSNMQDKAKVKSKLDMLFT